MRLKEGPIFSLGDTSFRRKTLLEDYKLVLPILKKIKDEFSEWNKEVQTLFYEHVLETDLFDRKKNEILDQRGRNLKSSLFKLGFVNHEGILGEAGLNWIESNSKNMDDIERLLNLSIDNIVFLRQLMKIRVYDKSSDNFFYPFRIAIYFLSCYSDVNEKHFLKILYLIKPDMNEEEIKKILDNYSQVDSKKIDFDRFIENNFIIYDNKELELAKKLFSNEDIKYDNDFKKVFPNRKTEKSQQKYYKFYLALEKYKKHKNIDLLEELVEISNENSIKKAFGFNRKLFKVPAQKEFSVKSFEKLNKNNPLLDENKLNFYFQFKKSKIEDIIREYSDINKRSFNLSGIIIFNNGLVNLHQIDLFQILIDKSKNKFSFSGKYSYEKYEEKINSPFYKDLTFLEITEITENGFKTIIKKLQNKYNISDISRLTKFFENKKEKEFNEMIEKEFTCEKILEILKLFSNYTENEKEIKKLVSDYATVPTIFEYVIAIAWYYISNKHFSIQKSLKLTLDGNFKPLSHAPPGDGDIIINYHNLAFMIEATLMDKNSQKRNELEPVIRHATNLAANNEKNVITIFIANELDNNVINIFKAVQFVELESSDRLKNKINGIKIFALSINDVIQLIKEDIRHEKIFNIIFKEYNQFQIPIKIGWHENIIKKLFE